MTLIDDGSRFVPWSPDHITGLEHVHRYRWAQPFITNKRVLDIASGEGYGSALLAQTARHVLSIDLDWTALKHARTRYALPNLTFVQSNAEQLALAPRSLDVIVCFETLEHINAHDSLLAAFQSALTEDGLLFISTPNKQVYTDDANFHNPHHVHELYHAQFNALLKRYFAHVNIFGQAAVVGSVLSQNQDGVFLHQGQPLETAIFEYTAEHRLAAVDSTLAPRYFVACCSQQPLPQGGATLLLNSQLSAFQLITNFNAALSESTAYVRKMEQALSDYKLAENNAREYIAHQARQMETRTAHLKQAYDESVVYVRQLEANYTNMQTLYNQAVEHTRNLETTIKDSQTEHDQVVNYVRTLEASLATHKETFAEIQTHHANLQRAYDEAVAYARSLEAQTQHLEHDSNDIRKIYEDAVTYARSLEAQAQHLEHSNNDIKRVYEDAVAYARSLETKIHDLEENLRQFTDIRR
jgi:SAM-dependent methyltransferase